MSDVVVQSNATVVRERLVTWSDPMICASAGRRMSGLELLTAMSRGEIPLPPVSQLIGMQPVLAEHGRVVFQLTPNETHYNTLGSVHGGIITTLLDTVVGCAVHSTLPNGRVYASLNISVNFIRAITAATGTVVAEGKLVHAGRTTAIARGTIVDSTGKLCATADSTCLLIDLPSGGTQ